MTFCILCLIGDCTAIKTLPYLVWDSAAFLMLKAIVHSLSLRNVFALSFRIFYR